MTHEQHRRAGEIFDQIASLAPPLRDEYLDAACGRDSELRRHVLELFDADRCADHSFLGRSAMELAAGLLVNQILAPGTQLGAYRIGALLGAGGMGTVYEAFDTRLERKVAVKVLPAAFVGDADRVRRFRQEARAASLLNHPNIVSIYDADLDQGHPYIATEFVEGKTLREMVNAEPIAASTLLDIAIQICHALSAAHEAGIVHRDIKPENVMVRTDGIVKVLDFGLAKLTETANAAGDNLLTRPGGIAGTLQYVSPEQVLGRPADPRSDIFSLGVVLYELETGVRPFRGPTDGAIYAAIVNDRPARPSEAAAQNKPRPSTNVDRIEVDRVNFDLTDPDLDALIMRALEKDPELRFQTAVDLRASLKLLVRDSASRSGPRIAVLPVRRVREQVVIWTMSVALFMMAGLLWYFWRTPASSLPLHFVRLTDAPGEELYPNLTPDGSQFVYNSAARGKWDIYLQRTGGSTPTNLTANSPDSDSEPALSRDGSKIAFRSERGGGGLFVMELTGENPTRISTTGHLPAWSPDGKSVVYCDDHIDDPGVRRGSNSRLHIIDLKSGLQKTLQTGDAVQPNWSPHGYRIAYWGIAGGERDLWTVGLDGAQPVQATHDPALDWDPVWSPSGRELYFLSDRGGSMNLWRVPIDERTGRTLRDPEPVMAPALYVKHLSWSAGRRSFAYSQAQHRTNLFSVEFDPVRGEPIGAPVLAGEPTINITNFSFSPDDSRIVYDTVGEAQENIWISNLDGSDRRRLTSDASLNRSPAWSPDGSEIAFFSDRSGQYNEWLIHPDGSGLRQLTDYRRMLAPAWIKGGRNIIAAREPGGLALLDPHVSSPISDPPNLPGFDGAPDTYYYFMEPPSNGLLLGHEITLSGDELVSYSLSAGKLGKLGVAGRRPVWIPGRQTNRFVFFRDDTCYLYDLEKKQERRLFSVWPNQIYMLRIAPNGHRIYFTQVIHDADIWMAQMGGAR